MIDDSGYNTEFYNIDTGDAFIFENSYFDSYSNYLLWNQEGFVYLVYELNEEELKAIDITSLASFDTVTPVKVDEDQIMLIENEYDGAFIINVTIDQS